MVRSPIYEPGFRPQFSGHETFPLRYGWLKKVYDAVEATSKESNNRNVFLDDEAIARFGVGKNMVTSMRYWALACKVIVDQSGAAFKGPFRTTREAKAIFATDGWDPYLEEPASLWWLHWHLASSPRPTTTAYFVFNHYHSPSFYRDQLRAELQRYCGETGFTDLAPFTLKRDVECFVRTYAARSGETEEESLESLMSELALVQPIGARDGFILSRGPKPSLPDAVFFYGLVEFARSRGLMRSFSVEAIAHDPGSPGRVFLLDEDALVERLSSIEHMSHGLVTWSETAGLRQMFFHEDPQTIDSLSILARAYPTRNRKARAA